MVEVERVPVKLGNISEVRSTSPSASEDMQTDVEEGNGGGSQGGHLGGQL